jgi:group I intron endonuclease
MQCGVYAIRNNMNGKYYVGSSKNMRKRIAEHARLLKTGRHKNIKLNRACHKYGYDAFQFFVVLICSESNRYLYEQTVMDFYNSVDNGYNQNSKAERGFSAPLLEIKDSYFLSKVNIDAESGCWAFNGAPVGNGMAQVKRSGVFVNLQRLSYEYYIGDIAKGMLVYRTCKNRLCINPEHLKTGTHSDVAKNTFQTGRIHARGNTKLTESQVVEIKMSSDPMTHLAKRFEVSEAAIRKIKTGDTWKHVNVRLVDGEDANALEPFVVQPKTPIRVWS